MRVVDLITKKRDGHELSHDEISYLIEGYVKGIIPDYQISALLMAIYFNPLSEDEINSFTKLMLESGEQIDLSPIKGVKVDKHSTGGVGDKTSLVVASIAAACGVKMAKMSGRGLGHTGGTIDKLESIPGFSIELTPSEFFNQVNEIGLAIIGQSGNITPADKKLYSLRDVTGTVESIGLIASSIMSKKLASGADYLVLDVKVGRGAFMKKLDEAIELAQSMVKIGKANHRETVAMLTDMEQPLGNAVGNALEVVEAFETLKGRGPEDFTELCLAVCYEILMVSKVCNTLEEAIKMVDKSIKDGRALSKLVQMISYQHGNSNVVDNYDLLPQAKDVIPLKYCGEKKFVSDINALKIGEAAHILGAGRSAKDDVIDYAVGIVMNKKIGDIVSDEDILAYIHTNGRGTSECLELIASAFVFSDNLVEKKKIVLQIIK